jgi:hypothetical protein
MEDWADHLLVGGLWATIAGGVIYAFTLLPVGQQTIWGGTQTISGAERNEIADCLVLFDDMNNGRLAEVDFGKAEECKKKVGTQDK